MGCTYDQKNLWSNKVNCISRCIDSVVNKGKVTLVDRDAGCVTKELVDLSLVLTKANYEKIIKENKFHVNSEESEYYDQKVLSIWKNYWLENKNAAYGRQMMYINRDIEKPCITSLHFMIRDNCLHIFEHIRSCNVTDKLFVDIRAARDLADFCCEDIKIDKWKLHINIDSAHFFPIVYASNTWDYLDIIRNSSLCKRRKVSSCVEIDNKFYFGYNQIGKQCSDFCIRNRENIKSGTNLGICKGDHSEIATMRNAVKHGSINGGILYSTEFPCINCANEIAASGIAKVVYDRKDSLDTQKIAEDILMRGKVQIEKRNRDV